MKTRALTIYLIKDDFTEDSKIISAIASRKQYPIDNVGILYIRETRHNTPSWASLFQGVMSLDIFANQNSSTAAVLVIRRNIEDTERIFAITFGYGKSLLEEGCYEERFGLMVTLNTVNKDKLRSIDKNSFDSLAKHTKEQTSKAASPTDFGLDIEMDILRAVTGAPDDKDLYGSKMTGIDALCVSVETELSAIPDLLERYYLKSLDASYRANFPWVDRITEIRDKVRIGELNEKLVEKIRNQDYDRLWMAVPEVLHWHTVSGFRYSKSTRAQIHEDIDIPGFVATLSDVSELTLETLKKNKVYCINAETDNSHHDWSIFNCTYCEIDLDNKTYLLNGGKWFNIDQTYQGQVNAYFESLPQSEMSLPPYTHNNEANYIEHVCNTEPDTMFLMDQKTIVYGGGHSSIEFCDIYTRDKKLIHIKRYSGSSVLSHLFSQGFVSAELMLMDQEFRTRVNEKLDDSYKFQNPQDKPTPRDYEIIYAIISKAAGPLSLPFFSRVNLRHFAKKLNSLGYRMSLMKINVN